MPTFITETLDYRVSCDIRDSTMDDLEVTLHWTSYIDVAWDRLRYIPTFLLLVCCTYSGLVVVGHFDDEDMEFVGSV